MTSAMSRRIVTLFAGATLILLTTAAFAQPTKQTKKVVTQKPAVATAHPSVFVVHGQSAHSATVVLNTHPAANPAKAPIRVNFEQTETFTPMDAFAFAYRPGSGNYVRQSIQLNSPVIERIPHGTQFHVIGQGTDRYGRLFYQVEAPDTMIGWMEPGSVRFL